jgi:hypothetical protein
LPPPRLYQFLIADLENSTMARGMVKWFNPQKGYQEAIAELFIYV